MKQLSLKKNFFQLKTRIKIIEKPNSPTIYLLQKYK